MTPLTGRQTLAASLVLAVLAGCAQPPLAPGAAKPGAASPTAITPAGAAAPVVPGPVAAKALDANALATGAESDLDAYDLLSDTLSVPSAKYGVFAAPVAAKSAADGKAAAKAATQAPTIGASRGRPPKFIFGSLKGQLPSSAQSAKLADRRARLKSSRQADLRARAAEASALADADKAGSWRNNFNGTSSKTLHFNVNKAISGQSATRQVTMVRTVTNDNRLLVSQNTDMVDTLADGSKHVVAHDRTLMADGSYRVVLKSEFTAKDGAKRLTTWDKTIDASGNVKGTGQVSTVDGSGKPTGIVPLAVSGNEANQAIAPIVPNKPSANPAAKATVSQKVSKVVTLVSRIGSAGVKVNNAVNKQKPLAVPGKRRYRLFDADAGSGGADVQVAADVTASAPIPANDGTPGDQIQGQTLTVGDDGGACETGNLTVTQTVSATGDVKAGELQFTPDADAGAKGEGAEDIKFNVTSANQATLNATIAVDASDASAGQATCNLTEQADADGNVSTSGSVTLPDGSNLQVAVVIHADGTRDLTAKGDGIGFKITGLSVDGVGTGAVYDGDPDDTNSAQIGLITLHNGADDDTIAFFEDDGTLGEAKPFVFAM